LATAALLLVGNTGFAADNKSNEAGDDRAVRLLKTIPVPVSKDNNTAGGLYSFDISWVDQATETYYLGDRSNKRVDIVDAKTGKFLTQINASPSFAGFTGNNNTSGPNGVVTGGHCLFVTDAPNRVVSFDTTKSPPAQVSDVSTLGPASNRADELAFEPNFQTGTGLLFVINNADTPPFGTFIKVSQKTCALTPPTSANKLTLDKAHGVDAQNGAEQPVFDPGTGKFYLSIPQIGATLSHGGVVRIKPNVTTAVEAIYPIEFCSPAGLALGPKGDLLVGCNTVFDTAGAIWSTTGTVTAAPQDVIIDAKTGAIDAHIYGAGAGDEVWFNKGDGNYYATGSGSPFRPLPAATAMGATPLAVIDAKDQKLLQLVPTYNVNAVTGTGAHPAGTSHSVAADAANNHVFVPLPANNAFSAFAVPNGGTVDDCENGCIAVFGHPDEDSKVSEK